MKRKKKIYEVTLDSEVFAISLVEEPAIESDFIYLSKQKPIYLSISEKHEVVGAVLIPNKPIFRYDEETDEEFYIQFSAQTIEKLAYQYMEKQRGYSTTEDHEREIEDVFVVESFIKQDDNEYLGMDIPKGSWVCKMKVNNPKVWERIKDGELRGFSIESMVDLKEIKLQINNKDNMFNFSKKKKSLLSDEVIEEIKEIVAEAIAEAQTAETTEEIEEVAEEAAEAIDDVEEKDVVEAEEETPSEEPTEDAVEAVEEAVAVVAENAEAEDAPQLQEAIDALQAEVDALKAENEELKKKNQKLSKTPSTKPYNKNGKANGKNKFDVIRQLRDGSYFNE